MPDLAKQINLLFCSRYFTRLKRIAMKASKIKTLITPRETFLVFHHEKHLFFHLFLSQQ